jgi:hypothetical protein
LRENKQPIYVDFDSVVVEKGNLTEGWFVLGVWMKIGRVEVNLA